MNLSSLTEYELVAHCDNLPNLTPLERELLARLDLNLAHIETLPEEIQNV